MVEGSSSSSTGSGSSSSSSRSSSSSIGSTVEVGAAAAEEEALSPRLDCVIFFWRVWIIQTVSICYPASRGGCGGFFR